MLTTKDIAIIKELLKNVATKDDLASIKNDLKKLEHKLDKKFTDLFNFLDKDVMKNKRKIEKIEKILQVSSIS